MYRSVLTFRAVLRHNHNEHTSREEYIVAFEMSREEHREGDHAIDPGNRHLVDVIRIIIPTASYGKDRLSQPANRYTQMIMTACRVSGQSPFPNGSTNSSLHTRHLRDVYNSTAYTRGRFRLFHRWHVCSSSTG
jgi:hypothetical protein